MAIIMTRECGYGPLLNNYLKITGISLLQIEDNSSLLIAVKAYLSKESRDYDKMKDYLIKNNMVPSATNEAQIEYLNLYWNKPAVLSVGEATLSFPIRLQDVANKTQEELYALAYLALIEHRGSFGYKNANPSNIIENDRETIAEFKQRVVDPFLAEFNKLGA